MSHSVLAAQRGDLRTFLRARTSLAHDTLEQGWFGPDGFRSVESYRGLLLQSLHVHLTLGLPAADLWGTPDDAALERARLRALISDTGVDANTLSQPMSSLDTTSHAWGVAYVLNGATLGASVMLKTGKLRAGWPHQYMLHGRAFVQSGGLMRFFERLNAAEIDPDCAVAGANACFAAFAQGSPAPAPVQDIAR